MRTSVDVHNFLVERDVPHELVPVRGRLRQPERWAPTLGLPPEQVGRVVLFSSGSEPVAALVQADRAPDPGRVARAAGGDSAKELEPDRATDLTGFLSEVIPPVGLPEGVRVVMDRHLSSQEVLYFPGGEPNSVLKIRARDLRRAAGAKVAAISR